MATLFNTKISATYPGLLKTIDNAALTASLKELTDGDGNQSGLYLNTAGDFKVTAILEWGSFKDTGTGVVITQLVTSTDGIENFDNNTTLPTSAAVKLYVDTKFSQTDTLTEVLSFGNVTSGYDIAVSAGDDITFTDTSKILMGASSDLQIYHDGANSYIKDAGTGNLEILADSLSLLNAAGSEYYARFYTNGAAYLYHNGIARLNTSGTGAEVTGDLVVTGTITGAGGSFLPLAGGTMTGNTIHNDNVKSIYGTASDGLEIYHDGSHSYIADTGTGDLTIRASNDLRLQSASTEAYLTCNENGSVEVYYNDALKFETTSAGVAVTGQAVVSNGIDVNGGSVDLIDNVRLRVGTASDLQIYHDGSNSFIQDVGTGNLNITSSGGSVQINKGLSENMAEFIVDGAVNLYYDSVKKFETVSAGAKVTGNLEVTGTITGSGGSFLPLIGGTMTGDTIHNDSVKSIYGTGSDLQIYHDGSNSYIQDTSGTGDLIIDTSVFRLRSANGGETMIRAFEDGAVILSHNNLDKLTTTSTGISVTGDVVPTGNVHVQDAGQLQLGTGINGKIYHDGNNFIANNLTGGLYIDQAAVTESIVFRTSDANALDVTALTINRSGDLITGRDVTIAGDLTVNGTTTTVNSQTLSVDDPLISLAINNSANSLDIGYYGKYNDGTTRYLGLFSDASDSNKFKLFKGTTVEPTTTVNIGAAGYVAADLEVAAFEASTGTFTGVVTVTGGQLYVQNTVNPLIYLNDLNAGAAIFQQEGNTTKIGSDSNSQVQIVQASGAAITIDTSKNTTFTGDVSLANLKSIYLGTSSALRIYTDSATAYLRGDDVRLTNAANDSIVRVNGDVAELYYNDAKKFETTTSGVSVTGNIGSSGSVLFDDNQGINFSNSNAKINGSSSDGIKFFGTGSEKMRLTQAGNLGIGTDSPYAFDTTATKLHVKNDAGAGNIAEVARFQGSADASGSAAVIRLGTSNDRGMYIQAGRTGAVPYGAIGTTEYDGTKTETIFINSDKTVEFKGAATFAGNVGLGGTGLYTNTASLNIDGTGLAIKNDTAGSNNNWSIIRNTAASSSSNIVFATGAGTSLTLNHDVSATFAGNVSLTAGSLSITGDGSNAATLTESSAGILTIASVDDLILDCGGDLTLDAAGNDIRLKVSGVEFGKFKKDSGNFSIFSSIENEDILFKGNDGGTIITALTLDMSEGGDATFAGDVSLTSGSLSITGDGSNAATLTESGSGILTIDAVSNIVLDSDSGQVVIADGGANKGLIKLNGDNLEFKSEISDADIKFNGNDGGSSITALTLDMSNGGSATFRDDIDFGGKLTQTGTGTNTFAGNVGIGEVSPNSKLHITGDDTTASAIKAITLGGGTTVAGNGQYIQFSSSSNAALGSQIAGTRGVSGGSSDLRFLTTTTSGSVTEAIRIDNAQNVGIGTTDPSERLHVNSGSENVVALFESSDTAATIQLKDTTGTVSIESRNDFRFSNSSGEKMRITSGGDVQIKSNPTSSPYEGMIVENLSNGCRINIGRSTSAIVLGFYNDNGIVGSISTSGSSTVYTTSSDYRLKEDLKDFNGLEMVSSIPVYDHKWKVDDSRSYGVMAHELQEVLPQAVSGEKDAEEMQSVDYSKIVPVLLKAIQELTAKVETLEANACKCKN